MNVLVITDAQFKADKRGKIARAILGHKGGSLSIVSYKKLDNVKLDASLNFIIRDAKIKKFVYEREVDENGRLKRRFNGEGKKGERFEWLIEGKEADNLYETKEINKIVIIKKTDRPNFIALDLNLGEIEEDTFYTKGYLISIFDVSNLKNKEKMMLINSCTQKFNKFTLGGGGNYYKGEDFYYSDKFTKKEIEEFKNGGILRNAAVKTLKMQVHLIYKCEGKNLIHIKEIERGYRGSSSFYKIEPEPIKKVEYSVYRSPRGNLGIYKGIVAEFRNDIEKIKAYNKASGRLYGANPETTIIIDLKDNRYCETDIDEDEISKELERLENEQENS